MSVGGTALNVISNGSVGIGGTSPLNRLDVMDTTDNSATNPSDYTGGLYITNNPNPDVAGAYSSIGLGFSRTADSWYMQSIWNANEDVDLAFTSDFSTAGVNKRLVIKGATGNVGIGTTAPTAKLDINSDIVRIRTPKTPATAGATGNQGDVAWDSNYVYVCIATNTWKRSLLETW